jgi:hypothetical protein
VGQKEDQLERLERLAILRRAEELIAEGADPGLAQVQAEGERIVAEREVELSRRGPRKLAPGEILSGCSPVDVPVGAVPWTAGSEGTRVDLSADESEGDVDG